MAGPLSMRLRNAPAVPQRSPWLVPMNAPGRARAAVVCLAFGGGSSGAFRAWTPLFPADVQFHAIDLPGHGARFTEPLLTRTEQVTEGLLGLPELAVPTIFFGHSLGALLAYEWAAALHERGRKLPTHLVLSGRSAPQDVRPHLPIHALPDAAFLAEVRRYQGMPQEVLEHRELVELLLPILRADFTITETHAHRPRPPLPVPLRILGGEDDPMVAPERLRSWAELSALPSHVETFSGGHFYLDEHRAAVVARILSLLPA
jgi:medium-chain acyl-[acyl-carrier-protein] hydrolase